MSNDPVKTAYDRIQRAATKGLMLLDGVQYAYMLVPEGIKIEGRHQDGRSLTRIVSWTEIAHAFHDPLYEHFEDMRDEFASEPNGG